MLKVMQRLNRLHDQVKKYDRSDLGKGDPEEALKLSRSIDGGGLVKRRGNLL